MPKKEWTEELKGNTFTVRRYDKEIWVASSNLDFNEIWPCEAGRDALDAVKNMLENIKKSISSLERLRDDARDFIKKNA